MLAALVGLGYIALDEPQAEDEVRLYVAGLAGGENVTVVDCGYSEDPQRSTFYSY